MPSDLQSEADRRLLTEEELWQCAKDLVREHGTTAPMVAALMGHRSSVRYELGMDEEYPGVVNWLQIIENSHELLQARAKAS